MKLNLDTAWIAGAEAFAVEALERAGVDPDDPPPREEIGESSELTLAILVLVLVDRLRELVPSPTSTVHRLAPSSTPLPIPSPTPGQAAVEGTARLRICDSGGS